MYKELIKLTKKKTSTPANNGWRLLASSPKKKQMEKKKKNRSIICLNQRALNEHLLFFAHYIQHSVLENETK